MSMSTGSVSATQRRRNAAVTTASFGAHKGHEGITDAEA